MGLKTFRLNPKFVYLFIIIIKGYIINNIFLAMFKTVKEHIYV